MKGSSNIYKGILIVLLLVWVPHLAEAQNWAVSTNALSWANLGTVNAEGSVSLGKQLTINAGFTANPWEVTTNTYVNVKNQQYGGYLGFKYWFWHVYSGWWIGAKAQYKNFEQVGLLTSNLMKGDAMGGGLASGYSILISESLNLDLGLGIWGGRLIRYKEYEGTVAKETMLIDAGPRNFVFVDNVIISLVYIF